MSGGRSADPPAAAKCGRGTAGDRACTSVATVAVGYHEQVEALLGRMRSHPAAKAGLYDLERIARDLLPCLRMSPGAEDRPGSTRLGGDPDLRPGTPWPRSPDGRAMHFVGQLDFADCPPLPEPAAGVLPEAGTLSVFETVHGGSTLAWTPDTAGEWWWTLLPPETPLERVRSPPELLDPGPYAPVCHALEVGVSVGSLDHAELVNHLDMDQRTFRKKLDFMSFESEPQPHHQVLGNAESIADYGVPYRQTGDHVFDIPAWERLWGAVPETAGDWTCVWTIDSNHESGMSFSDWGKLRVCTPTEDLVHGDFRRTVVIWTDVG